MVMDDDSDLGSVLESSRGMDGSDEDGSAGGCRRGRRRDSDEPNELGVFSMFATTVPERGDGERPATVRGMAWRTVLLFAWYVGVYVANIWYYLTGHGEYERASLAILSWFGVRWHDTWLGGLGRSHRLDRGPHVQLLRPSACIHSSDCQWVHGP